MSRGLHCPWLAPRTRASSERHAYRGYFLVIWVRRGSSARCMQWFIKNTFIQRALGFKLVLTTGCRNLCPMTTFKVSDSVC
ncbi:hypothetical protein M9H77_34300 [Catharanthus roseus]|uniref:Uncharacterized protein n=1 Tax=Catharanthus roseus TaxID=4058 RepID=A0ACB9ZPD8_CATRO|nr:hypothetical protein M9H77_34300 [Catharanthus roseus]